MKNIVKKPTCNWTYIIIFCYNIREPYPHLNSRLAFSVKKYFKSIFLFRAYKHLQLHIILYILQF